MRSAAAGAGTFLVAPRKLYTLVSRLPVEHSGRNLDGIAGCNSARTLGRNLTRYSARNGQGVPVAIREVAGEVTAEVAEQVAASFSGGSSGRYFASDEGSCGEA